MTDSLHPVRIYRTERAADPVAGWISSLLSQVTAVCRFAEQAPAVEIRAFCNNSEHRIGGLAPREPYLGLQVVVPITVTLYSRPALVRVYLHEAAHQLVRRWELQMSDDFYTDHHSPLFFTLVLILSRRLDTAGLVGVGQTCFVDRLSLYDFRDQPLPLDPYTEAEWRSIVIKFSMSNYRQLADSHLSAEQLPAVIVERWMEFLEHELDPPGVEAAQKFARLHLGLLSAVLFAFVGWTTAAMLLAR